MKKLFAISGIALAGLLSAAPASAISVSFVPSANHINVGDAVTVQMNISGLGGEILSSFDINMLFNNTVLSNNGVTHNVASEWPGGGVFGPEVFGVGDTGVIDYAFDDDATLAASQADAFTVLTFSFTGSADGFSFLNLGLDPDFQRNFVGLNFATLQVDVGSACISVGTGTCDGGTSVPEPGTLALLSLGILGLGMSRRRRVS